MGEIDGKTRLWASVIVACVAIGAITTMLIAGVPVADIATAFLAIGTLVTLYLVSEVQQVKANTNGNIQEMQAQIKDLIEYTKTSLPVKEK